MAFLSGLVLLTLLVCAEVTVLREMLCVPGVVGHNQVLAGFFAEISAAKLHMVSSSPALGPFVLLETQER